MQQITKTEDTDVVSDLTLGQFGCNGQLLNSSSNYFLCYSKTCRMVNYYDCSRLTLNAGSLLQFCQVPILLRPLFIPLKSLVRDDTQQVRYNGKCTELV